MELSTENLKEVQHDLREIANCLELLEKKKQKLIIGIEDIMEITGWSKNTVRQFMHRPDFPLIKVGKDLQVNYLSFVDYTMNRIV